jgi:carbon monoxide dehydrogenase subunit G
MTRTSISISVRAPIEKVFAAIADIDTFPYRAEAITHVELLSEQRSGVGARFRETRMMKGRESQTELEVTEYVENDRIRMVADQGGTIWDTVFVVERTDSETRLNLTMDAKPYSLAAKLTTPLIKGMIAKFIRKDMDDIKAWCEAGS